jgi:hypothetical protein
MCRLPPTSASEKLCLQTEVLYSLIRPPLHATCSVQHLFIDLITIVISVGVRVLEIIVQFSPAFFSLRSKHFSHHSVLGHPQLILSFRVKTRVLHPYTSDKIVIFKLHNVELYNLYSSPNIIRMMKSRRMRWTGHVERMGEKRNAHRTLVGKPEGKRSLGRLRRK